MRHSKLGQHFVIRGSVLERIASAACAGREPLVVEIGPGRGALTEKLLTRAEQVIAIELDPFLVGHLEAKFARERRLRVIQADAIHVDLGQWGPAVIAGNLPYYAATPILKHALSPETRALRAVFLLQKEVAQRVTAVPGQRDYGYLSVETQLFAHAEMLFEVKPSAFHPPPKVDSAAVRLDPCSRLSELGIEDPLEFLAFVAQCFAYKRKTIRNNLATIYDRKVLDTWPEAAERGEQLSLEQFAAMYRRHRSLKFLDRSRNPTARLQD